MTDKLTPKSMEDQCKHQLETFKRKNHDYGNSFEKSLDAFGLVAGIVRMNDKFERLLSLTQGNKNALVGSESLVDTLEDLSNYAAMAACYLKGKKVEDWKGVRLKELDHAIDATKIKAGISSQNGVSSFDPETGNIVYMPGRCSGKTASFQQAIKESLDKQIEIEVTNPQFSGPFKEIPEKVKNPKQFIRDCINAITDTVLMKENKDQLLVYMDISDDAGRMAKCIIDNNISRNVYMSIISNYWHKHANIPVPLREFIIGVIERHIYYMKKSRGLANALDNHKIDASKINTGNVDIGSKNVVVRNLVPKSIEDIQKDNISARIDAILEDIRKETGGHIDKTIVRRHPFDHNLSLVPKIKLDLEPYLEEMRKRREKEVREKPLSELMAEHAAAQRKAMDDLDMMLDAMANGQLVSRVVNNGDGSFVAYWEKSGEEDESGEE